ncbi:MAG: sigma-70 family RNA polymerase sigma factor [Planctomycetes bacterium]|nr:sigma-70 family RNA polymerase sigma factor [Planctomycetota bacterium]
MAEANFDTQMLQGWLSRMRGGDAKARDEMLRALGQRLERLAGAMLRKFPNVQRWEQTADVFQNAIVRLMRSLEKIEPENTRAFLGLAAEHIRRELLDLARHYGGKQGLGANHASVAGGDSVTPLEPAQPGEDAELDLWAAFHEAVANLPAEEREVVSLSFYHGWTQKEIAALFGVDERTIRRRWNAAMLRLREPLQGKLPSV